MKDLSGLDVHEYFRILWNRRWYFLIVFVLVSVGGTIHAKNKPAIYRSEAKIAVDTPLSAVSRSSSSVTERIDVIREQLSSRSFLERMIQQTGSYGFGASSDFVMERALTAVRNNIRIQKTSDRTFTIAYRATDPMMAQNVTRQFTDELIRASKRSSETRVMALDRFVEEQFSEAEEKLRKQSEKIRDFKQQNAGKLPEQTINNMNAVAGARSQLSNLENAIQRAKDNKDLLDNQYHDNKQLRSQLEQINSYSSGSKPVVSSGSSPEELDLAQKTAVLSKYEANMAQALTKYTENHPDIAAYKREIDRLEREIEEARGKLQLSPVVVNTDDNGDATPRLTMAMLQEERFEKEYADRRNRIEAEIEKLEKEREATLKVIADYELRLKTAPTLEQELEDLFREENLLKKQYESIAAQKLNSVMATAVETDKDNEIYRVIDEANFPVYPEASTSRLMLMAIFGGLAMGVGAAFGRELLDSTIGSEEEAKKIFDLPVLAAIPAAPKKNKKTELRKTA